MIRRYAAMSRRQLVWLPGGNLFVPASLLVSVVLAVVTVRGRQGSAEGVGASALDGVTLSAAVVGMAQFVPVAVGVLVVLIDEVGRSSRTVRLVAPAPAPLLGARMAWVAFLAAAWGGTSSGAAHLVAWMMGSPVLSGWKGVAVQMGATALYSVGLALWSAACARIIGRRTAAMSVLVAVSCVLAPIAASMVEAAAFLPGVVGRCLLLATEAADACAVNGQGEWGPWVLAAWALTGMVAAFGLHMRQDA